MPTAAASGLSASPLPPMEPVLRLFFSPYQHSLRLVICLLKALRCLLIACSSRFGCWEAPSGPAPTSSPVWTCCSVLAALLLRPCPQLEHAFCLHGFCWLPSSREISLAPGRKGALAACFLSCFMASPCSPLWISSKGPATSLQAGPLLFILVSSASGRVPDT